MTASGRARPSPLYSKSTRCCSVSSLRSAFGDGPMPAIEVYEVGGAYLIEDGHHRVALARERRADFIDAEVTSADQLRDRP